MSPGDQTAQKTPELIAALAAARATRHPLIPRRALRRAGASHAPAAAPFKGAWRAAAADRRHMDARTNSQGIAAAPLGLLLPTGATCCGGPSRPAKR
ncbi:hypothetical protein ACPA9J_03720 [Pseudomonas aeruginosa]